MPLKLTVGLTKKIGQPNYGSLGACCNIEFELDSHVQSRNPALLQAQIKEAFAACTQAVESELARQRSPSGHVRAADAANRSGSANGHANGHTNGHSGNGHAANVHHQNGHRKPTARQATASQVKAIVSIASRLRLDLARELQSRFQVDRPENLSISDASRLIGDLKTNAQSPGGP